MYSGCSLFLADVKTPTKKRKIEPVQIAQTKQNKKIELKKEIKEDHSKAEPFVQRGDTLLFEGKINLAYRQYAKALTSDPDNIPAAIGLAKCYLKENKPEIAYSSLSRIESRTIRTPYAPEFCFLFIQASILQNNNLDNTDLKKIENAYYCALTTYRKKPELYYYMGLVCKKILQFNRAKTFFSKASSFKSQFSEDAYKQINQIKKLEQCSNCNYSQRLPLKSQISRADMAYILYHELHLNELLSKKRYNRQLQQVKDIDEHPLKDEIYAVLPVKLSGLSLFSGAYFQAEMPLTRGDFAQILYEIIQRVSPQIIVALNHKKKKPSIVDIRPSQLFYNSVIFCTQHQIVSSLKTSEFNPYGPISGADAMMGIRTLKKFFNQYDLTREYEK